MASFAVLAGAATLCANVIGATKQLIVLVAQVDHHI